MFTAFYSNALNKGLSETCCTCYIIRDVSRWVVFTLARSVENLEELFLLCFAQLKLQAYNAKLMKVKYWSYPKC